MTASNEAPIIKKVKKIKKGGHHGGSWKIAYADFVTAMMAFFLVMWLLSSLNKYQLGGLAEYFRRPLKDVFTHKITHRNNTKGNYPDQSKEVEVLENVNHKSINSHESMLDKTSNNKQNQQPTNVKENNPAKEQNKAEGAQLQNQKDIVLMETAITEGKLKELKALKSQLENKLKSDPLLRQFQNQLNFIITADGLKIELKDLKDKPMFSTGKADFKKYARSMLSWLGPFINKYPNRVVIVGHTDSAQYKNDHYTNWELSADRANATRRALIESGVDKGKIIRVVGVADTKPEDAKDSMSPNNRRIEILVLTDEAIRKLEPAK